MVKKIKPLQGLGAKYGASLRKKYSRVFRILKTKRQCPECGSMKFRRGVAGIWVCPSCNYKVAGGAYDLTP